MKRGGTRAALVSPEQCVDAPRHGRATERPCLSGLVVSLSDPLQMGGLTSARRGSVPLEPLVGSAVEAAEGRRSETSLRREGGHASWPALSYLRARGSPCRARGQPETKTSSRKGTSEQRSHKRLPSAKPALPFIFPAAEHSHLGGFLSPELPGRAFITLTHPTPLLPECFWNTCWGPAELIAQ